VNVHDRAEVILCPFFFNVLLQNIITHRYFALGTSEYFELQSSETGYTSSGNLGHFLVNR
jgi:hypothetical protein